MGDAFNGDRSPHPLVAGLASGLEHWLESDETKPDERAERAARRAKTDRKPDDTDEERREREQREQEERERERTERQRAQEERREREQRERDEVLYKLEQDTDALNEELNDPLLRWKLAFELADHDPPELLTFAGYLGALVDGPGDRIADWRVFYVDDWLDTWLLFREKDIVLHNRLDDETAAFGKRDIIWVRAVAQMARGTAPPSAAAQSRFLSGEFTRASQFAASLTRSTSSDATGIFCGAVTMTCCRAKSLPPRPPRPG